MRTNPLFQEGIQVYLVEGHGFAAYFYLLLFLASLEFLTLFLPSLDPQAWMGPANLFKVSSVAALMLVIYFTLRIANQEFVPWRFISLALAAPGRAHHLRSSRGSAFSSLPPCVPPGFPLRAPFALGRGHRQGHCRLYSLYVFAHSLLFAGLRHLGPGGAHFMGTWIRKPAGVRPFSLHLSGLSLRPRLSPPEPRRLPAISFERRRYGPAGFVGMEMARPVDPFAIPLFASFIGSASLSR